MPPVFSDLALVALAPLLAVQGARVRRDTLRLPEPPGPRFGVTGAGAPLRLLVLGDSAAAGVGVDTLAESLLGQLLHGLAPTRRVTWQLVARTGMTSTEALSESMRGDDGLSSWDVVVTSLGVNDVTALTRPSKFARAQSALIARLGGELGASLIVLTGLPPMGRFPALPQPLRAVLGARASRLDATLRGVAVDLGCVHLPLTVMDDVDERHMAADGFHPGAAIYARWAQQVVEVIER